MATLLIIDDEQDICDIVRDIFEDEGFCVLRTKTGTEGVHLAKTHRPDVVLLDMKLGSSMTGVDVLSEIKRHDPAAKIIVITGASEANLESEAREMGVDAYVEKPFTPPQIVSVVRSVFREPRR